VRLAHCCFHAGIHTDCADSSLPTTNATSSTTPTCALSYTDGLTTISGTGTLPKPTAFVTRNGVQLQLSDSPYRIVGPNIYWLGLDEVSCTSFKKASAEVGFQNVTPIAPPSRSRVREAMAIAVAMGKNLLSLSPCRKCSDGLLNTGANTIRSLSLGISVGSLSSIEPSLNVFNDSAFDALDYALFAAREYGKRQAGRLLSSTS
jgi:mannan endo-1,4-beta-mannosidase